jgi:hypothetical protein
MRRLVLAVLALLLAAAALEAGLRVSRVAEVPLYRPSAVYGYAPSPDQSGAWRGRRRWVYDAQGLGVAEAFRPGGVLLVGDSIVNGGNQTDQPQRLGPQLSAILGRPVWPLSAGSWALLNELAYLNAHPQLVGGVDRIVLVLGSGDFDEPSVWRVDPDHPDHKPRCVACYLIDREILAPRRPYAPPPKSGRDWRREFQAFARRAGKPILVVLYTERGEAPELTGRHRADLGPDVLAVADDPRWRTATFRDRTHVDPAGTRLLATLIGERLKSP